MNEIIAMTRFRTQLKALMLNKGAERGEPLTQREVSEETNVSLATISRLYNSDFDRIDADTLYALLDYFGCTFEELIERVKDNPSNQKTA